MQSENCKSCGKPMISKFQMDAQMDGEELPVDAPLTSNLGYWHCEACDVYVFHAEYSLVELLQEIDEREAKAKE